MIDRRSGIGGSEAAAVCGLSRWSDPMAVWLVKTGRAGEFGGNLATRVGLWMEKWIAQEYSDVTGRRLQPGTLQRHEKWPWMLGTPDFLVMGEPLGLEVKFTGHLDADDWGPAGTDLVPIEYLCQVQQYMAVCDRPLWDLAVVAGTREFRLYHLARDEELIGLLREEEEQFFVDHVLADVPPAMETAAAMERYLRAMARNQTTEAFVKADPEAEYWSEALRAARGSLKVLEEAKDYAEAQLKRAIWDAAGIEGPGFRHTWKQDKPQRVVDWQGLALDFGATAQDIAAFTTEKPGNRRFLVNFDLDKENA